MKFILRHKAVTTLSRLKQLFCFTERVTKWVRAGEKVLEGFDLIRQD